MDVSFQPAEAVQMLWKFHGTGFYAVAKPPKFPRTDYENSRITPY